MNIARHWRERISRYRLEGQRHRHTGEVRFPAQPPTLDEDPNDWEPYQLSGRGEIYSFSVIRQAPSGYESLGIYPVALVRLEEGPLVTAQLTDCDEADLAIGMPVEMVTRRLMDTGEDGVLVYGYKFRPCLRSS
ncbi:Zn-ribbon domain-containing OB-fold protein [Chloroflexus sp.]|uniref:Zn-ribbon domain-containing OB-fold protein n=1 Tax=Chloroflexus sp. TaxID=1904827 RepID=UPI003D129DEB